jgi:hypothetical protein
MIISVEFGTLLAPMEAEPKVCYCASGTPSVCKLMETPLFIGQMCSTGTRKSPEYSGTRNSRRGFRSRRLETGDRIRRSGVLALCSRVLREHYGTRWSQQKDYESGPRSWGSSAPRDPVELLHGLILWSLRRKPRIVKRTFNEHSVGLYSRVWLYVYLFSIMNNMKT